VLAVTETKKKGLRIPKWIDKVLLAIGFALLAYVVSRYPFSDIETAVGNMFPAVLLTPLIALCWACTATTALYTLLERQVPWWKILWIRLVGDSYNALLPMAGFGGEPFKLRQLSYYLSPTVLMSTFIRDRILDNVIGFVWSAMGCTVGVLAFVLDDKVQVALIGYSIVCLLIGVFGTALVLTRVPGKLGGWLAKLLGDVAPEQIDPLPAGRVAVILFWYTCSRALGVLEKVTLLWILGAPHDFASAAFVDGFLSAAGYIGFMIPQGLGIFEGATVFALGVLGAPGPAAIAFAFARRGRMIVVGLFGISLHVAALAKNAIVRRRG
jgi:hypothetical protein